LDAASNMVSGFEDAAAGDTSVMSSLANAASVGTAAAGVDSSVQQYVDQAGSTAEGVNEAVVAGDAGAALTVVGEGAALQAANAGVSQDVVGRIQDSSAIGGVATNTLVNADGNGTAIASGIGEIVGAAGAATGGELGETITTSGSGVTAVGTNIAKGDAAGATGALVGATGGVLETYNPEIGENLKNSEALATGVVQAGQDGDVGAVITTSADLAAQQIANEQTSALIHGLGVDTAAGVEVGGAEGALLALNHAAATTN